MVQHTPLAAPDFAAWNAAALRALTATTPSAIAEALDAALRLVLDFDVVLIAALHRDAPPSAPYYGGAQEPSPAYHDGPYLLDPFYNHFLAGTTEGCFRLSELAPEGFLRSEYFSSYYRHLEIGDELGLLTALGSGSAAHVSITRRRGRSALHASRPRLAGGDRAAGARSGAADERGSKSCRQRPFGAA